MELYVLYDNPKADDGQGRARVKIGVGGELTRRLDQTQTTDGRPLKLAFRAIFKENRLATEWQEKLHEQLRQSGQQVGNEFFFVDDAMLVGLHEAAAQADQHEWLIPLADSEYVNLTMELKQARQQVEETFDVWCQCTRTASAEIKINSYAEYIVRNDKRIHELKAEYVVPRFYNDGAEKNAQLDYTITQIKEDTRKRSSDMARLRRELDDSEQAFAEWQAAIRRVAELEDEVAAMSPMDGDE
jgi:hypothetical protein